MTVHKITNRGEGVTTGRETARAVPRGSKTCKGEVKVPLVRQGSRCIRRIVTNRPIVLNGLTSALAKGKVVTRRGIMSEAGVIEPVASLERFGVKGELVVDKVTEGKARTLLVNENKEAVFIPKGVVIGLFHPLPDCPMKPEGSRKAISDVVASISFDKPMTCLNESKVPPSPTESHEERVPPVREELENLFDLSHIDNPDRKEKLLDLLEEFEDIVSRNPEDVGVTNKLHHVIETGDACPIRQAPRRESPEHDNITHSEDDTDVHLSRLRAVFQRYREANLKLNPQKCKLFVTEVEFLGHIISDSDASDTGIGGVLSQVQDGRERVILYYGRALSREEQNYCTHRKEMLAAVEMIARHECYLLGPKFTLRTDHSALQYLQKMKNPTGSARVVSPDPPLPTQDSWIEGVQAAEISTTQLSDPVIGPVLADKLAGIERPDKSALGDASRHTLELYRDWELLEVHDGVLYRCWHLDSGLPKRQLLVPKVWVERVLHGVHDNPEGGHLGIEKTKEKLLRSFYWPGLTKDVVVHVTCCDTCATTKGGRRRPRAPLQSSDVGYPNKRIAIDIVGPLPKTTLGNKYVLVLSDYFSKWVEVFPMPDETALTVAQIIFEGWICVHGPPERIHTDQGRNFESALIAELCKFMKIGKTRTTPYHPQSDGMVERFNRTLGNVLRAYVSDNQRDWDTHLPMVKFAYNTSEHSTTKFTPYFVMHGREARLPVELMFGTPTTAAAPVQEYVKDLVDKLPTVFKLVADNTKQAHRRQKDLFDRRVYGDPFQEGDKVLLAKKSLGKGLAKKLARKFEGPFTVVERVGGNAYRIRKSRANTSKVVHFENLVPYKEKEEDPDYVPPLPRRPGRRALTPGTRPGRQVRRRGGLAPPVLSLSGSDSDDDGELGGADVAAHPGDLSGEETAASSGEDTDETASSEEDGSAQLDETDDETRPKGVAAQTDGAAGGATQDGGGSDASAEGNAMSTRAQADEASDDDDGGDDSGSGPRRSTRSRQPPERYGSYVYRVTVGHSRDGRHDVNNVNSVNNVNCGSNNAKLSRYRHNPGIRESPAMVGQVTPPLTEEQQGVCEGSKALDESAGSWLDSIFCFMRRSDAQSKVEIV
ncbi:hypothetical protein Bbelb_098780 [Branchiostoma belcheri]|nr:hypothetical protein Bbelb_098780 [Branchiostoma belcheri]